MSDNPPPDVIEPDTVTAPSPRERQLAHLRPPWKPGESGNPGGRLSERMKRRRAFLDDIPMILNKLKLLAMKGEGMVAVAAAREFIDRVEGKVPQAIIETARQPLYSDAWSEMPDDRLDEIIAREGKLPDDLDIEALARDRSAG